MKTTRKARFLLLFLCIPCAALAPGPPAVVIQARQFTQPNGNIRYEYRVANNSHKAILGFSIGSDYHRGESELKVSPAGWTFDKGLAAGSITSPRGWHAIVITTEDSPYIELEWRSDGSADIPAGKTSTGFSVVTPKPDPKYLNGHWNVFFPDSAIQSGSLRPMR